MLRKMGTVVITIGLFLLMLGCEDDRAVLEGKLEPYNELVRQIDKSVAPTASGIGTGIGPGIGAGAAVDPAIQSQRSLHASGDMAIAQAFGLASDPVLQQAGKAVKAYPHPLLLNNFAAMLGERGSTEDSLYFYTLALRQQPDNPILLTNIANHYVAAEDFEAAERYAGQALRVMRDFGPAYQVLTTVHLRNERYELAAETMVKSAKHAFNEVTEHHFESFLQAVQGLNPLSDEFPLKEAFMDELYTIARSNVDTAEVKEGVDTPGAQIRIKPFPTIGNADHLMRSEQYVRSEAGKLHDAWSEAQSRMIRYGNAYSDYMRPEAPTRQGTYPIQKNVRQIYAYLVLESYYKHRLEKERLGYLERLAHSDLVLQDQLQALEQVYEPKLKEAAEAATEANQRLLAELFSLQLPDVSKSVASSLAYAKLDVDWKRASLNLRKQNAEFILRESQQLYSRTKQLLEEYWLKSGGLLKYIRNEDVFHYLQSSREKLVYDSIGIALNELEREAYALNMRAIDLQFAEQYMELWMRQANMPISAKDSDQTSAWEGSDLRPDIEKEALATYPERGDIPDITFGLEASLFGNGASITSNGDAYELSLESTFGSVTGQSSFFDMTDKKAYVLYGVKAEGNTDWFTDKKVVQRALEGVKGAKALGKIGIGHTINERTGEYITSRDGRGVMDRGFVYVKETGGELGPFGRTEKTEVFKSYMTGVVTVSKSVKYKFMFASIQVSK